jgi:hypothetical protein
VKASPPSLATARTALVINQFATPGLGSLMAGRYLAGSVQLLFALAGFFLIVAWFFMILKEAYAIMETTGEAHPPHYLGWMGLGNFAFAWGWAWFTSISVLRQAQRAHDQRWQQTGSPPIIAGAASGPDHK